MRTLLAIAMLAGGILSLDVSADSAEPAKKRSVKSRTYATAAQPRTYSREEVECERAQHEDPTAAYAGYPCWAREVFGRSKNRNDQ
jgi:hypothetical protein